MTGTAGRSLKANLVHPARRPRGPRELQPGTVGDAARAQHRTHAQKGKDDDALPSETAPMAFDTSGVGRRRFPAICRISWTTLPTAALPDALVSASFLVNSILLAMNQGPQKKYDSYER